MMHRLSLTIECLADLDPVDYTDDELTQLILLSLDLGEAGVIVHEPERVHEE